MNVNSIEQREGDIVVIDKAIQGPKVTMRISATGRNGIRERTGAGCQQGEASGNILRIKVA